MPTTRVSRSEFLEDRQGKTFADVADDPDQLFDVVLEFFGDANRQRRMEESELHHDRAALAGVVRELESQPAIDRFLAGAHARRSTRLRQAIGVLVRMIMERRGWQKTGRKGSLGVRAAEAERTAAHNSGGLAFWFIRAERYKRREGMPFRSVPRAAKNSIPRHRDNLEMARKVRLAPKTRNANTPKRMANLAPDRKSMVQRQREVKERRKANQQTTSSLGPIARQEDRSKRKNGENEPL